MSGATATDAPLWQKAWREFQDPYLGPDTQKFPSPFESFVAGFLAGRASVTPSREQIAETIYYARFTSTGDWSQSWESARLLNHSVIRAIYVETNAILALLAVPSTENEAKPDTDICSECGHHHLTTGDYAMSHADWIAFNGWLENEKRNGEPADV